MHKRTVVMVITVSTFSLPLGRVAYAAPPTILKPGECTPIDPNAPKPSADAIRQATIHVERANALYRDASLKLALIEYQRAYDLAPNFRILYNVAQTHIQLNNYAAAMTALQKYLADGCNNVSAKRRADVSKDIVSLQARTAHLTVVVRSLDGAEVSLDDNSIGAAPISNRLVDAGDHRIAVSKEGYITVTKSITLAGGDESTLDIELAAIPPPPPPPPPVIISGPPIPHPPHYEQPPPSYTWLGWVGTGVLAAGALTTGVLALGATDDFKAELTKLTQRSTLDADRSKAQTMGYVTDGLIAAAVVSAGVTTYFTFRKPRASAVHVGVAPGGLRLDGRF